MARCFLARATGEHVPRACPRTMPVSQCTRGLGDRAFQTFTQVRTRALCSAMQASAVPQRECTDRCVRMPSCPARSPLQFFTNVHAICVFVSNQDVLRQAEAMTRAIHAAGLSALTSLDHISANLTEQHQVNTRVRCAV